jgi:hypothetical protein
MASRTVRISLSTPSPSFALVSAYPSNPSASTACSIRAVLTAVPPRSVLAATRKAFSRTAAAPSSLRACASALLQYCTPANGSVSLRASNTTSATATSFRCSWCTIR